MKIRTIYNTMLGSMFLRLFWLSAFETKGSKRAIMNHPDNFIVHSLPYVVYPSMGILLIIILLSIWKKPWAYMAGMMFGITHFILIIPLVIYKLHSGFGPFIVIPACLSMIVFSYLSFQKRHQIG